MIMLNALEAFNKLRILKSQYVEANTLLSRRKERLCAERGMSTSNPKQTRAEQMESMLPK
jgi:hypothetical protein